MAKQNASRMASVPRFSMRPLFLDRAQRRGCALNHTQRRLPQILSLAGANPGSCVSIHDWLGLVLRGAFSLNFGGAEYAIRAQLTIRQGLRTIAECIRQGI